MDSCTRACMARRRTIDTLDRTYNNMNMDFVTDLQIDIRETKPMQRLFELEDYVSSRCDMKDMVRANSWESTNGLFAFPARCWDAINGALLLIMIKLSVAVGRRNDLPIRRSSLRTVRSARNAINRLLVRHASEPECECCRMRTKECTCTAVMNLMVNDGDSDLGVFKLRRETGMIGVGYLRTLARFALPCRSNTYSSVMKLMMCVDEVLGYCWYWTSRSAWDKSFINKLVQIKEAGGKKPTGTVQNAIYIWARPFSRKIYVGETSVTTVTRRRQHYGGVGFLRTELYSDENISDYMVFELAQWPCATTKTTRLEVERLIINLFRSSLNTTNSLESTRAKMKGFSMELAHERGGRENSDFCWRDVRRREKERALHDCESGVRQTKRLAIVSTIKETMRNRRVAADVPVIRDLVKTNPSNKTHHVIRRTKEDVLATTIAGPARTILDVDDLARMNRTIRKIRGKGVYETQLLKVSADHVGPSRKVFREKIREAFMSGERKPPTIVTVRPERANTIQSMVRNDKTPRMERACNCAEIMNMFADQEVECVLLSEDEERTNASQHVLTTVSALQLLPPAFNTKTALAPSTKDARKTVRKCLAEVVAGRETMRRIRREESQLVLDKDMGKKLAGDARKIVDLTDLPLNDADGFTPTAEKLDDRIVKLNKLAHMDQVDKRGGETSVSCWYLINFVEKKALQGDCQRLKGKDAMEKDNDNEFFSMFKAYDLRTTVDSSKKTHMTPRLRMLWKWKMFLRMRELREKQQLIFLTSLKARPVVTYAGHQFLQCLKISAKVMMKAFVMDHPDATLQTVKQFVEDSDTMNENIIKMRAQGIKTENLFVRCTDLESFYNNASRTEAMQSLRKSLKNKPQYVTVRKCAIVPRNFLPQHKPGTRKTTTFDACGSATKYAIQVARSKNVMWLHKLPNKLDPSRFYMSTAYAYRIALCDLRLGYIRSISAVWKQTKGAPQGSPTGKCIANWSCAATDQRTVDEYAGRAYVKRYEDDRIIIASNATMTSAEEDLLVQPHFYGAGLRQKDEGRTVLGGAPVTFIGLQVSVRKHEDVEQIVVQCRVNDAAKLSSGRSFLSDGAKSGIITGMLNSITRHSNRAAHRLHLVDESLVDMFHKLLSIEYAKEHILRALRRFAKTPQERKRLVDMLKSVVKERKSNGDKVHSLKELNKNRSRIRTDWMYGALRKKRRKVGKG